MFKLASKVFCFVLGTLFVTHTAWADFRYELTVTNEYTVGQGKTVAEVSHQKAYVRSNKFLLEEVEAKKSLLVHFDYELLYHLNKKTFTYTKSDLQAIKTAQKQQASMQSKEDVAPQQRNVGMDAARKQLSKMGEGLSPQRRNFMIQMMQRQQSMMQGDAPKEETSSEIILKDTKKTKTINGFPCRRIKVVRGKKKIIDAWVTTQAGPKNYFKDIVETLGLFKPEVLSVLKQVEGFPITQKYKVQLGALKDAIQTVVVTKIEETTIPLETFELPKGYTKQEVKIEEDVFAEEEEEEESF